MVTVLITKSNEDYIKKLHPRAKFTESTKHTSTFNISETAFLKLQATVRQQGYNPYAIMSW